ncbi:DUF418 domain-containing protein [Sunxiuqinia sp. A32]|uniref:DUF418 domain-containing protein n=1 Tax=Sunxiuqinia sp. A32 TaxID=3461496 RepID=UPI0040461FBE
MEFKPSNKQNRIEQIDALRGFALLGIIIANIPYQINSASSETMDSIVNFLFYFLIDKKFITIFSLLFGFGFYIQMKRAEEKQINFQRYFAVRMLLLYAIGTIHAFALWNGDILRAYAFGGIILLFIRNWSVRRIFILAILLIVVFTGIFYIGRSTLGWGEYNYDTSIAAELPIATSFFRYIEINAIMDPWTNFFVDMPITLTFTLGNILIGFILGKTNFFKLPEKLNGLFTWLLTLGVSFGLASSYIYYKISIGDINQNLSMVWVPFVVIIGMVTQSFFYIVAFLKLYQINGSRKALKFFNPVGRAALSNYLLQSLLYIVAFYHVLPFFQWFGKLDHLQSWMIAIGFFLIQSTITNYWFRHFSQGPIEFVWKRTSYKYAKSQKQK